MDTIKTTTSDGLIFNGLIFEPANKSDSIIIHIHGMSGDIYSNSFYPAMQRAYPDSGIAFLVGEHRGTHSITQFNTTGGKIKNIGNAYEIFEDSAMDIEAWVNKAVELGYKDIWLQGHSLGPSKIVNYLHTKNPINIKGLILLSPSDMLGLVKDPDGLKDHQICLPEAIKLIEENKGNELLSHDLWGCMRLSANTYFNFFNDEANTAVFNYWNPDLAWEKVKSINIPTIAFTGTKDDGIVPVMDAYKAMEVFKNQLTNCPRIKTIVFENAVHDFTNFGEDITSTVINFIKE
jgi:pimeloyl-ACP methyl ester carboxylesterase